MKKIIDKIIDKMIRWIDARSVTPYRYRFFFKYIWKSFRFSNIFKTGKQNFLNYWKTWSVFQIFLYILLWISVGIIFYLQIYFVLTFIYLILPDSIITINVMDWVDKIEEIKMTTRISSYCDKFLHFLYVFLLLTFFLPRVKRIRLQKIILGGIIIIFVLYHIYLVIAVYMWLCGKTSLFPHITELSKFEHAIPLLEHSVSLRDYHVALLEYHFVYWNLYLFIYWLLFFWSAIWDTKHTDQFQWFYNFLFFSQIYCFFVAIKFVFAGISYNIGCIYFQKVLQMFFFCNLKIIFLVLIPLLFGLFFWHCFFERFWWLSLLLRLFLNLLGWLGVCYVLLKIGEFNQVKIYYKQIELALTSQFILEAWLNEPYLIVPLIYHAIQILFANYKIYIIGIYLNYWIFRIFGNFWKSDDEFHFFMFCRLMKKWLEIILILLGCVWLSELKMYDEILYQLELILHNLLMLPGINSMITTVEMLEQIRHKSGVLILDFFFTFSFWLYVSVEILVISMIICRYFASDYKQNKLKKSGKMEQWKKWLQ